MTISIIIPTFNRVHYLPRAIQSIYRQEINDIEIVIVDDGSTDGTAEYITTIPDPRIHYIRRHINKGIGFTRREAIEAASGDLIAFLDTDDEWFDKKLWFQEKVFKDYPQIDILFTDYINEIQKDSKQYRGFDQNQKGFTRIKKQELTNHLWLIIEGMPESLLFANFIATSSVMFRKNILPLSGNFNPDLSGPEDFEFWWRAALKGAKFGFTDLQFIRRNKNNESISADNLNFIPKYINALEICSKINTDTNHENLNPLINAAMHRAWRGMIREYALLGDKDRAVNAFKKSSSFGKSARALKFLFAALLGPKVINFFNHDKFS